MVVVNAAALLRDFKGFGAACYQKVSSFFDIRSKGGPLLVIPSYKTRKHHYLSNIILEGLLKKTMQSLWPLVKVIFYDVILANVILQNKYLPITLGKALLTTAFLSLSSLCCWAMSYVLFFQVTLYDLKVLHKKPDFFLDFLLVK